MIVERLEVVDVDVGYVKTFLSPEPCVYFALDALVARQPGQRVGAFGQRQVDIGNGTDEAVDVYNSVIDSAAGDADVIHPDIHLVRLDDLGGIPDADLR